jgi:hypothetical protein
MVHQDLTLWDPMQDSGRLQDVMVQEVEAQEAPLLSRAVET